ncbi:Endo-1 4-beta-xylanase, partial [Bienertia sinuspersici]
SLTTTAAHMSVATEAASQSIKKRAMLSPLTEVAMNEKWGPFLPPNTTAKCAHSPSNNLGPIWKNLLLDQHQVQLRKLLKTRQATRKKNQPKLTSMVSPNMPPNIPHPVRPDSAVKTSIAASQDKQTWQKTGQESKEISKKSKSLRPKSLPNWPQNIDFDDKEEVLTIDAKGNTALVSGVILPINVWSNNGAKYFVEFNDLCQPIRKGGHFLIRFIGMMAKMETHCLVREEDWHAIDSHIKGKTLQWLIKPGGSIDSHWNKEYYKAKEKTLDEMCSQVPPSRISSNNWIKLLKYWDSDKGKVSTISTATS